MTKRKSEITQNDKKLIIEIDQMNAMFDDIRTPLIIVNGALRVQKLNTAARRMFGDLSETLAELSPSIFPYVQSFIASKKLSEYTPQIHIGKGYADLQVTKISADGILIAAYDATREVSLSAQLKQAQKMETVGQLASGVAHDFSNVLTVIGGFADIANKKLDGHPAKQYIEHIYNAAAKGNNMIRGLLAFSRRGESSFHITSLNQLIRNIVAIAEHMLHENVTIITRTHPNELLVMVDSVQIEQSILNLLTNAQDAMPEGGKIEVETGRLVVEGKADLAYVKVSDEGNGMDPIVMEQIFTPFFTTKPPHKGTGLGLAMVKEIIENHSGKITSDSTLDVGTTFSVYLPIVAIGSN